MSHSSFITLCISHIIHSLQCCFDSTVSSGGQGWHCEAVGHDICSRESEALSICVSRRPTDPPKRCCESLPTPLWSSKAFCAAATSIASWAEWILFVFVTIRQVHFRGSLTVLNAQGPLLGIAFLALVEGEGLTLST